MPAGGVRAAEPAAERVGALSHDDAIHQAAWIEG